MSVQQLQICGKQRGVEIEKDNNSLLLKFLNRKSQDVLTVPVADGISSHDLYDCVSQFYLDWDVNAFVKDCIIDDINDIMSVEDWLFEGNSIDETLRLLTEDYNDYYDFED